MKIFSKIKNSKKAAIQLSMSFLVMLIIAIVIFILSLGFLGNFFNQSVTLKTNLDQQTRVQIENMLAGNERVAIPLETRTIKRGDAAQYGIGIKNTLSKTHFLIEVGKVGKFIPIESPDESKDISCANNGDTMLCTIGGGYSNQGYESTEIGSNIQYIIGRNGELDIDINKDDIVTLAVQSGPKSPRGHYILNVYVCSEADKTPNRCKAGENIYGDGVQKVHLIVR